MVDGLRQTAAPPQQVFDAFQSAIARREVVQDLLRLPQQQVRWLEPFFPQMFFQFPVFPQGQRFGRLPVLADVEPPGQQQDGFGVGKKRPGHELPAFAKANGHTSPAPCLRSNQAHTVIVHRESAISSTNSTGSR